MSSAGPFDANAAFSSFLASLRLCASPAELHAKLSQFLTLVLLNPEGCVDACLLVVAVATAPLRSIITHQFPGHPHFTLYKRWLSASSDLITELSLLLVFFCKERIF